MPETRDPVAPRSPARRTIVKGAAWAVPAVTLATATPALAASAIPPNGLNGWVEVQRPCTYIGGWPWDSTYRTSVVIDGMGSYPNRGIWIFISDPEPEIINPYIIFYFQRSNLTFTNQSEPGWSNLTRSAGDDSGAPTGYFAYRTSYTGAWAYTDAVGEAQDRWVAVSDPKFSTIYNEGASCSTVRSYARRTVTVNGETVSFIRGPITLN